MGFDECLKYISGVANRFMSAGIWKALKPIRPMTKRRWGTSWRLRRLVDHERSLRSIRPRDGLAFFVANFCSERKFYESPANVFGSQLDFDDAQNEDECLGHAIADISTTVERKER